MSKIRQIDYSQARVLVAYSGKRAVKITEEVSRYQFAGVMVEGIADDFAKVGDVRRDWQKSSFPLPWTDSPERVEPE